MAVGKQANQEPIAIPSLASLQAMSTTSLQPLSDRVSELEEELEGRGEERLSLQRELSDLKQALEESRISIDDLVSEKEHLF
jgi:predicted  nucleic acid-binding Zn-ribbon protein